MKTALITGANGFIGRHIALACKNRNLKSIGIGHGEWSEAEWKSYGLESWIHSDVTLESLIRLNIKPDIIFHCAGSGSVAFSIESPEADFEKNVKTSKSVLEFARLHAPLCRIVLPSSAAVYGMTESKPILESFPKNPISVYGRNKKMAEDLFLSYSEKFHLKTAIVRLFSVYGPGLKKQLLFDACMKVLKNENLFYGTGSETRDWIFINDAVDLLFKAAENAGSPSLILNGGTGTSVSVKETLTELYKCFQKKEGPAFNGNSKPGDPPHYQADSSKAHSLGWAPQVLWKEGLRQYCNWFRDSS